MCSHCVYPLGLAQICWQCFQQNIEISHEKKLLANSEQISNLQRIRVCFGNSILISLVSLGQRRAEIARAGFQGYINVKSCYKIRNTDTIFSFAFLIRVTIHFYQRLDGSFKAIFATKQEQNGAKYRKRKAMPSKIWKVLGQNLPAKYHLG